MVQDRDDRTGRVNKRAVPESLCVLRETRRRNLGFNMLLCRLETGVSISQLIVSELDFKALIA